MEKMMFSFGIIVLLCLNLGGSEIYIRETSSEIIFGNSQISLHFAKENGFLHALFYKPLNLQIIGHGNVPSPLDIRVEGEWLVEKTALREVVKGKGLILEGKWKFSLDPEDKGLQEGWHKEEYDDTKWDDFPLPTTWEKLGYNQVFPTSPSPSWEPYNGYAFLRRKARIPKEWEGKDLLLYIGAVDDFDWVYLNGQFIGHTGEDKPNWWEAPRLYTIPARFIKFGQNNTFCIRIYDRGGEGGVKGPVFLIKKEDWEELRKPIKFINYELKEEGRGKKLLLRSGVGDWIIESGYTIYPQSDVVLRDGKIIYKGEDNPHLRELRFTLSGVSIDKKDNCWYIIPSNFPPLKYNMDQEGRIVEDHYAWASNRCVILRNDELNLNFLTIFYSETEGAGSYVWEKKEGLDVVHTLYAEDILEKRKELEGGTQVIRIVKGTLQETLKKEQEIYDIIGLTPPLDRPDWARKAIIYSAYPGGTMDSGLQDVGGFDNFTRYLSHLADLGFNVLWLLPVWPGLYGPTDYYKIEESLGGVEAARRFIEEAHRLGLRVLFDLIPHGPREESGLLEELPEVVSRDREGKVIYWWGCLSCDYASEAWQNYMAKHAAYWVRELNVDGYRVDCAGGGPANWDTRSPHRPTLSGLWGGLQVLAKVREEMRKYKDEIMLLPEATGPWFFRYSDVVYDFPFMFISQNYSRYHREEWLWWFREWLEYQKFAYPKGATLMRFVESHDTVRFAGLNGNGTFNAFLALCALIEGAPMVYHDGDVGRGPFLKKLYGIRKAQEELSLGEAHYLAVQADKRDIFTCLRILEDKMAIVAINMSGEEKDVELHLGKDYLPTFKTLYLYEAFEGKNIQGEIKNGELIVKLRIGAYSPAIILIRKEKKFETKEGFSLPGETKTVYEEEGVPPTYEKKEGEIIVQNDVYKAVIDTKGGMLKHLSLKEGENWVEIVEWEEGRRRLGMGERLKASEIIMKEEMEREREKLLLRLAGEGKWASLGIEYVFDRSNRIDVRLRLSPKENVGVVRGELRYWFKIRGVERWLVNAFEGVLYDDFIVRHFREAKGSRYWHIPYLYEANRYPLNPYFPLICVFRKDEYLAILLPPFYALPENIYIRERIEDEGFHLLLAMADGKGSWRITPGERYEMAYSLFVGRGKLPLVKEEKEMPKIICDGADYKVETSLYKAFLGRRNGQVNSIISKRGSLLKKAEIYSDKGIYGEYYDSLGKAFPLVATSDNDPEAEVKLTKEKSKILIATHSFLREGNSGWNEVARPLVEYQTRYEFNEASPYIKTKVAVRPFTERKTVAFLAQRLDFEGITSCLVNGEEISLSEKERVWESKNRRIKVADVELVGEKEKASFKNVEIPDGGNLFLYNLGGGNIVLFFAFMDGETKIEPRWYEFNYDMGVFKR